MALGSYERGDRAISARKLLEISRMYGVPVSELFSPPTETVSSHSTTFDLRKLRNSESNLVRHFLAVMDNIAKLRSDWNGEVISLRAEDLKNLHNFSGFSAREIEELILNFSFPRRK